MLWQRIISALVGIPLVIWISFMGGNWFFIAVGVIILLGLYEYGNMVRNRGYGMPKLSGYLSGLLIISAAIFPDFVAFGVFFLIIGCSTEYNR